MPALSNFLNANAALSSEMAIRLDKAFGVDMETLMLMLMLMQTSYDIAQAKKREGEIDVAPYVAKPAVPQPALL